MSFHSYVNLTILDFVATKHVVVTIPNAQCPGIHEYYGYSLLYYHLTNKSVTSVLWLITDAHKLFLCLTVTSVQREAHKQSDV